MLRIVCPKINEQSEKVPKTIVKNGMRVNVENKRNASEKDTKKHQKTLKNNIQEASRS